MRNRTEERCSKPVNLAFMASQGHDSWVGFPSIKVSVGWAAVESICVCDYKLISHYIYRSKIRLFKRKGKINVEERRFEQTINYFD